VRTKRKALNDINDSLAYQYNPKKLHLAERNNQLYNTLKGYRMCILPDERIRSLDSLPHFEFMENVKAAHHEELKREKMLRQENGKRIQRIAISTIMDESEVGGHRVVLSLREFNQRMNEYQLRKYKKLPEVRRLLKQPDFFSPSINVTNERLLQMRA
jgi:hypothetical protein